ncbi:MAG TPA: choice-of-anchor L domain-containing protein [Lentimicrobium sp.]|nr:choice-of-anchor L domain-containing protein [Lentimicrobium sp.]
MKTKLLSLIFAGLTLHSLGQTSLQIQYSSNLDSLVYYFIESGVTFSNVESSGHSKALGSFWGGMGSGLGIETGIVLSSGDIMIAEGPNNSSNAGYDFNNPGDSQLNALTGGNNTHDASALQFDLIPEGNVLAFNYVFGSEEYPEFAGSPYNDVFAFFISGPRPEGGYYDNQNIALIPGTDTFVSINTINQFINQEYYISNIGSQYLQYDGSTVVMPIMVYVIPNQQYHLKIALADCMDGLYDSGVFLQSPSLKSYKKDYTEPFAREGAEWHYTLSTANPEVIGYKTISYVSDTLIDEKLCSKMLEQDFEQSAGSKIYHYMYQRNDSVFFFKDGVFNLLYDFGAVTGDTIQLGYYTTYSGDPLEMIIDSTGTIMVGSEERKIQYVTCGDGMVIEFGSQVIEGIGSTAFMFPTLDFSYDGPLRCYSDNNTKIFHNPFYNGLAWNGEDCEEIIVSLEELFSAKFIIFPNPASDIIKINGLNSTVNFRILTTNGTLVKQGSISPSGTIDIRNLDSGIYLVEIVGDDFVVTKKYIRTTD